MSLREIRSMRYMPNVTSMKKIFPLLATLLIVGSIFTIMLPSIGHAQESVPIQTPCGWDPSTWPACFLFAFTTVIGSLIQTVLVFAAFILELIILANQKLLDSPGILTGFEISLSFVNLGFILAIVIIAIMTILRREQYGMKQNLWRLIVAALLVNFSLVFARVIIGFADELTTYFVNALGGGGIASFGLSFANGFKPEQVQGILANSAQLAPTGFVTQIAQQAIGAFISILMLAVVIIVMAAFIVMMTVRYVTLGVLIVVMPFAWLLWIFPSTRGSWDSWWKQFIRWNMFAPIVMFFIFLALKTQQSLYATNLVSTLKADPKSAAQAYDVGYLNFLKTFFVDILGTVGQNVIIIGLMIGGLYAANKFSITGAKAGLGAAKGAGKAFGTYVARRPAGFVARTASSAFQKPAEQPPATGWGRINPLTWRAQVRQGMRQVGSRIPGAGRAQEVAAGFAQKFEKDRGLIGSLWQGAGKGSGLWGRGKTKTAKGKTASGEDVELEIPDDETGTTPPQRQSAGFNAPFPPKQT